LGYVKQLWFWWNEWLAHTLQNALRFVLRLTVKQAEFAVLLDLYQLSKINNMTSKKSRRGFSLHEH